MPHGCVLVLNIGSSSLKFCCYVAEEPLKKLLEGKAERLGSPEAKLVWKRDGGEPMNGPIKAQNPSDCLTEIERIVKDTTGSLPLVAIGQRVVHGGMNFTDHQCVTPSLIKGLKALVDLAPNHLPPEIEFLETLQKQFPDIPQIACFDTVFHRDLPVVAHTLPLPRRFQKTGLRRYGFHGLSYAYLMGRLPDIVGTETACGRVILAHLGNGASLAAVKDGKSIDTTMGLTPLGGVVMATRSGDLDPGIAEFLVKSQGVSFDRYQTMVAKESGMLGISETASDIRDLLETEKTDPRAAEAIDVFCYSVRKAIGALAAALDGIDVLVFSGGIGEHAPDIRHRICAHLSHLGIGLNQAANEKNELRIGKTDMTTDVLVVPTDEAAYMAATTIRLLGLDKS